VLVAAVLHASWNLLAKRAGGDVRFILLVQLTLVCLWSPVGLWVALQEAPGYGALQWLLLVGSGAIHLLYFLILMRGYQVGDLSVVYPLARGSGPLLTALVASLVLDESLGWLGWSGVLAVVFGIFLIAGGPSVWRALRAGARGSSELQRVRAGVTHGLATGVFIAAYSVIDGYAVKRAGISPIAVDYLGNCARLPLTLAWLVLRPRQDQLSLGDYWRPRWRTALAVATLAPVAYVLVLYAAQLAPLSQVTPAREVSMLFAALFGGTLLRERDAGWRVVGAAAIAGGVVALASA
jgi:drug/metabolite transporter (DMT)-like permease